MPKLAHPVRLIACMGVGLIQSTFVLLACTLLNPAPEGWLAQLPIWTILTNFTLLAIYVTLVCRSCEAPDPQFRGGLSHIPEVAKLQLVHIYSEHPKWTRGHWSAEVYDDDTQLGYWEWVEHRVEEEHNVKSRG